MSVHRRHCASVRQHTRSRRPSRPLIGAAAAGLLLAGTATTAAAATPAPATVRPAFGCSGGGCNGTDPAATGCWDASAYRANSVTIRDRFGDQLGYVVNWYSKDCGTNWSEVFVDGGSKENLAVRVYNSSVSSATYRTYYSYAWSDQIYSPSSVAYAFGSIAVNATVNGSATAAA